MMPERTELLYGQVFQKMSKSPYHRFLCQRLLRMLRLAAPEGCFVWQEQPMTCPDSEPEPDLALIRGEEDDFAGAHPRTADLVIEVCVTSYEYDRSKLRAYASAGVKECWLVLGLEQQIEVHLEPEGQGYARSDRQGPGGHLASAVVPRFTVELEKLFEAPRV